MIENNPCAYVLGTSATPIRPEGMIDTVDLYFEGNLFYELTLPQAWYYNILPVPVLVQSAYGLDNELDRLQRKLERSGCSKGRKEKVQRKLDLARVDFKEALGAPEVIRKFLPTSVRKLLVFCRDLTDLKQMVPEVCGWLTRAGRAITPFEIHHAQGERQNSRILDAFREESDRMHVLFSVNMLIEGLHVEGVDASCSLDGRNHISLPCNNWAVAWMPGQENSRSSWILSTNLSGKSVYDVMAPHLERYLSSVTQRIRREHLFSDDRFSVGHTAAHRGDIGRTGAWQIMYERLIEFRREENDWPSVTEGKLGLWCNTQRIAYKRGKLQEERRRQLDRDYAQSDTYQERERLENQKQSLLTEQSKLVQEMERDALEIKREALRLTHCVRPRLRGTPRMCSFRCSRRQSRCSAPSTAVERRMRDLLAGADRIRGRPAGGSGPVGRAGEGGASAWR